MNEMVIRPLSAAQLRRGTDPASFHFDDTSLVSPSRELIGQQRAVDAIHFGLHICLEGYNIHVSGESGEGKTRYALNCSPFFRAWPTFRCTRGMP